MTEILLTEPDADEIANMMLTKAKDHDVPSRGDISETVAIQLCQ